LTNFSSTLAGKRIELVKELFPEARTVAVLALRNLQPTQLLMAQSEEAARKIDLNLVLFEAVPEDIEQRFRNIAELKPNALIIQTSTVFNSRYAQLAELALHYGIPSIHEFAEYPRLGGLISYGPSFPQIYRRAAWYVDRIFKGVQPRDLPVGQPSRFELAVNLRTAKALGIVIPESLLARADEVIE
jgi:putative ABC transport system substrate-binding protein